MSKTYIGTLLSSIVHTNAECRHLKSILKRPPDLYREYATKPSHHTVCDNCQRLDKAERRK